MPDLPAHQCEACRGTGRMVFPDASWVPCQDCQPLEPLPDSVIGSRHYRHFCLLLGFDPESQEPRTDAQRYYAAMWRQYRRWETKRAQPAR